ncbi:MAG: efflux RND transporter periplasmic adaptor subunit [Planctomycetota bacterium]
MIRWFALLPLILGGVAQAQGGLPPANVVVDAARTESLVKRRSVTGEIVSTRRSLVAAQADGYIIEFDLIEGDTVRKGDVIARLDAELATLDVEQAQARLAAAEGLVAQRRAEADNAQRDLDRVQRLVERNSVSESELDDAETQDASTKAMLTQAEADVAEAKAALAYAERRLRDKTVIAPFDAAVISAGTELGEWLDQGDTVIELIALDTLEARIDVPERLLPYLETAESVTLNVPALGAGVGVEADFIGLVPLGDSLSRNFTARLRPRSLSFEAPVAPGDESPARPRRTLKPGMSLTALVPTGTLSEYLTVHKDAILRDDAGTFVYAAMPGEPMPQATPMRIEILFATVDRVALRPGSLPPQTKVLVEGNERVDPTQSLVILNANAPSSN